VCTSINDNGDVVDGDLEDGKKKARKMEEEERGRERKEEEEK